MPLTPGVASEVSHDHESVTIDWTDATGGVGTVAWSLQFSPAGEDAWAGVSAGGTTPPVTATAVDDGILPSTAYDFRVEFTDEDDPVATVYSNTVTVTTDSTGMTTYASTDSDDHAIFTASVATTSDLTALTLVSGAIGDYDWSGMSLQFDRPEATPTGLHLRCQDNAASTTVLAAVGSNATLTNAGNTSASSVAGPSLQYPLALSLDGTNDYINCGDAAALTPAGSFTVAGRFWSSNWAGFNFGMLFAKSGGTNSTCTFELRLNGTTGVPQFVVSTAAAVITTTTGSGALTNSTWYHLAGVYNGSVLTLYVNGVVNGTPAAHSGAPAPTTEVAAVGQRRSSSAQFPFGGRAADIRMYHTTALSAAQVLELADGNRSVAPCATLITATHAVCARHAGYNATQVAAGDLFYFRTPAGALATGTVEAKTQIGSGDVALIRFTANPSAALARYAIFDVQDAMLDRQFWAPEHDTSVNRLRCTAINSTTLTHTIDDPVAWSGSVLSSGRPNMVPLDDGSLAILGTHYLTTAFPRLDYHLAGIQAELANHSETASTVIPTPPVGGALAYTLRSTLLSTVRSPLAAR
jgi:hypothetical protein